MSEDVSGEIFSLANHQACPDEAASVAAKLRAEIDHIAHMIEEAADAAPWPEEADRLGALAERVRARAKSLFQSKS